MPAMNRLFASYWQPLPTLLMAGVLAALYFGATGALWAVTGEFTRWGGNLLQLVGVDGTDWQYFRIIGLKGQPWDRMDGWLVGGMLVGGFISALASRSFKLRWPAHRRRWLQGLVGGLLAGFGTRLAMGCNLAAFFTGLPQFSFHAWLFIIGTAGGTWIGARLVMQTWFRGRPKLGARHAVAGHHAPGPGQRRLSLVALLLLFLLALWNLWQGHAAFGGVLLTGAVFGLLLQRGQICFTSAFRDLWLTGRGTMTKAIILGMGIETLLVAIFIHNGQPAVIHWASPGALIGGVLFGVGIVIAGGCETGWMYRSMEGQVQFLIVGVGNIIGATVLAYGWDHWGIADALVMRWPEIDLAQGFGMTGAIAATFAFLALGYLMVRFIEKRYLGRLGALRPENVA